MSAATLHNRPRLDHLVVMADTLAEGVDWCQTALGVVPGPGGEHPMFGTHNRLLSVASDDFPLAYLEIIAINPEAENALQISADGQKRWFDMDDEGLRVQVRAHGPRLIHWVARVPDLQSATARLAMRNIDRGELRRASRMTPGGLLEWQITVRPDGQRLMGGCLPTLIQWGAVHPAQSMPASGLALRALTLRHPRAAALGEACRAVGLVGAAVVPAHAPAIEAVIDTPRGAVTLTSWQAAC